MKKQLLIALLGAFLLSCAGSSDKKSEETESEQEQEMVETINADLEEAQNELSTEADESLNEIDSLLQNVE